MKAQLLEILRLKRRPLIVGLLLLLVTIALFVVVDGYQAPRIAAAQTKWSELRRQVALSGRTDLSAVYRRNAIDLDALKGRIPPRSQFPRILGEILEQAASSGVSRGPISYKPRAIGEEKLLAYGVTMNVSGRYAAIKSFLADLLNSRELVVVEDFSLTAGDFMEEKVTMDLHLTIYLREDA